MTEPVQYSSSISQFLHHATRCLLASAPFQLAAAVHAPRIEIVASPTALHLRSVWADEHTPIRLLLLRLLLLLRPRHGRRKTRRFGGLLPTIGPKRIVDLAAQNASCTRQSFVGGPSPQFPARPPPNREDSRQIAVFFFPPPRCPYNHQHQWMYCVYAHNFVLPPGRARTITSTSGCTACTTRTTLSSPQVPVQPPAPMDVLRVRAQLPGLSAGSLHRVRRRSLSKLGPPRHPGVV